MKLPLFAKIIDFFAYTVLGSIIAYCVYHIAVAMSH